MLADQEVEVIGKGRRVQNLIYIHPQCAYDMFSDSDDTFGEHIDLFDLLGDFVDTAPLRESPYLELREYFRLSDKSPLTLTFRQIEQILGGSLPVEAYFYDAFWYENMPGMTSPMWREEGYPFHAIIPDEIDYYISDCWTSRSISYGVSPEAVNFVLVDLGANDLMPFEDLPHLACPVVRSQDVALQVLNALVVEMERRKDLELTNKQEFDALPRLVLVVDEFPALFNCAEDKRTSNALRDMVSSLLRRGRHGKIHVVLAAQNPTYQNMKVDLGNITARIAFQCAKKNFSEVILGEGGAERLSEPGDLLLKATNSNGLQQIRGAFVTSEELTQLVQKIAAKWQGKRADCLSIDIHNSERGFPPDYGKIGVQMFPDNQLLAAVVLWVIGREAVSVNLIQHTFKIGGHKATELVKQLEDMGLVGRPISKLPRHVTPISFEDIPAGMLGFLQRNGITDDAVKLAISARDSKTTELVTRQPYEVGRHPVEKTPAATQDFLRDDGPGVEHAKTSPTVSPNYKSYACRHGLPPKKLDKVLERLGSDKNKGKKF